MNVGVSSCHLVRHDVRTETLESSQHRSFPIRPQTAISGCIVSIRESASSRSFPSTCSQTLFEVSTIPGSGNSTGMATMQYARGQWNSYLSMDTFPGVLHGPLFGPATCKGDWKSWAWVPCMVLHH